MPGAAVLADCIHHRHHLRLDRQAFLHGRDFTGRHHFGKHRSLAIRAVGHVRGGSRRGFLLGRRLCAAARGQGQQSDEQRSDQTMA